MHLRKTCSAAAAFSMLLRLKGYLKSAYGLTAARCQSYKPNEATKVRRAAGNGQRSTTTKSPTTTDARNVGSTGAERARRKRRLTPTTANSSPRRKRH